MTKNAETDHNYAFKLTRRYGPLRGPTSSSCGGLRPSAEAFFALQAKKSLWEQMFHVIVRIPPNIFVQHIDL